MRKLLPALLLLLLFVGCKKKEETDTVDKLATIATIENNAAIVYGDTLSATHDSIAALNAAAQWLLTQPEVDKVFFRSTVLLDIHFINGLIGSMLFVQVDATGHNLYRGGGEGNALRKFQFRDAINTEKIKNKKVMVLNPFAQFMYRGGYNKAAQFEGGPEELDVHIFNDDSVNYNLLSTFGNYGLVILNTHGLGNGFCLRKLFTISGSSPPHHFTREEVLGYLKTQGGVPLEKFENGELVFNITIEVDGYTVRDKVAIYLVTDKFIRNASFRMDGAVVFGNYCYSACTADGPSVNNMPEAWRSKGVISYYGYGYEIGGSSNPVEEESAQAMEDSLIANLCRYGDSTGIAHLKNNTEINVARAVIGSLESPILAQRGGLVFRPAPVQPSLGKFHLKHFYDDNYAYGDCSDTLTDSRDGQKYPTVCIGEQKWMAKNLNWAGAGHIYEDDQVNGAIYGRLYSWDEVTNGTTSAANPSGVTGVCPVGWHVPSDAEFVELVDYLGGDLVAGGKAKAISPEWDAPNYGATNSSGFSALPGGYMGISPISGPYYRVLGSNGNFWSCTINENNASQAYYWGAFSAANNFTRTSMIFERGHSVRCVKD